MYCGSNEEIISIRDTLHNCYFTLSKVLWPITPLLIEESWSYYGNSLLAKCVYRQCYEILSSVVHLDNSTCFYEHNFKTDGSWKDSQVERSVETALEVKRLINQRQTARKNTWYLAVNISCYDQENLHDLKVFHTEFDKFLFDTELCEILQVNSICLNSEILVRPQDEVIANSYVINIEDKLLDLCPRCRRFAIVDPNPGICTRCSNVLQSLNKTILQH